VAGTYCRGQVQGRFAQKLGDCAKCEIYQEAVEHDPLNKIGENFNSLMWVLQEKEDMLAEAHEELQTHYAELQMLQEQTREMADTDMLTGLKNHGHFQNYLKEAIDRATKKREPVSVVMLDLDLFKSVNDEFGHQKGDAVLSAVGHFLKKNLRAEDYIARYGGEEFVIVMPDRDGIRAVSIAEDLREKITCIAEETGLADGYVSGSFGIADFPGCASDAGALVAAADSALLFSKRKGRNKVAYFKNLNETELEDGDVERLHSRLRGAGLETIRALAEAVDETDQYSKDETLVLSRVALGMAEKLGLEKKQADALELATRLHDIGKIGVPGSILRKKEKLTSEELAQVQRHPVIGRQLVEEAKQMKELISGILYHHERWDGSGYPEKLKGEEIPLTARVVGILDAYRAMRSDRPYRKALTLAESIQELRKGEGSQFDPVLTEMFIDLLQQIESKELKQAV
jgi:diguanylate cyclase (GGDEF)-like protein